MRREERDFLLFDQRKQREHLLAPLVRRRVLREVARMAGGGSVAEVIAASPAVQVLGEELLLGQRVVSVKSAASPSLSFSQHIGSQGRMGVSLSCGFNNALRCLDTLSLELKSHYGEGTSYEAGWLFPFSALPGYSFAVAARRGNEVLAEGLRAAQQGWSIALRGRGREERELQAGVNTRRLEMDPADFAGRQTACARRAATALSVKYARRVLGSAGADCNARLSVEALVFRERPPDLKTRLVVDWRVAQLPWRFLRHCALKNFATLDLHNSLPGGPGISPQHASTFPSLRGFSAVEANVPFPAATGQPRLPTWEGGLAHSCQLEFRDFSPFGQGGLLPFFHATTYARLRPGGLRLHASLGVGLALQLQPGVRAEAVYSFAHLSTAASPFNRPECFQIRVSTAD